MQAISSGALSWASRSSSGIPLFAGLVLAVPGLFFGWRYRRTYYRTLAMTQDGSHAHRMATRASATDHALHNTWALGIVLVLLFGR